MYDVLDQIGVDTFISPRFDCQKCNDKMVPFIIYIKQTCIFYMPVFIHTSNNLSIF